MKNPTNIVHLKIQADYASSGIWIKDSIGWVNIENILEYSVPMAFYKEVADWNDEYMLSFDDLYKCPIPKELNDDGLYLANTLASYIPSALIEYWGWEDKKTQIREIIR